MNVTLDESMEPLQMRLKNRILDIGYEMGVIYGNKSTVLGIAFPDSIEITAPEILSEIRYQKKCSVACVPGEYRMYDSR